VSTSHVSTSHVARGTCRLPLSSISDLVRGYHQGHCERAATTMKAQASVLIALVLSTLHASSVAAATVSLGPGGNLQAAIDTAAPGDVIELAAGATFTGNFVLPLKSGTSYITIRTAASESLPGLNDRVGPEHSGRLARLQSPNGQPAVRTAEGAHHWALVLLEFGPTQAGAGDIIWLGDGSTAQSNLDRVPHDLIVDRCYIHGDPARGQKRGIALNSASTSVLGSYISDIKSSSQDAQAIAGWNGPGPYLIENNYLEASGENFMLGGATPGINGVIPSDVVFRRNHVTRPASWRNESWSVKNLFELKNGRRVLVEGNLFETHWQGAQPGYAIVMTPRGERGAASWATVEDVTFRYNVIRNVAAVFNLLEHDDAGPSGPLRRIHINDNLIYGVDRAAWGGNGTFIQIGEGPAEIVIEHNTVLQTGNVINAYGGTRETPSAAERFVFRDNITMHNANGVIGQSLAVGNDTLAKYFPGASFFRNVLAGGLATRYPADNMCPTVDWLLDQFQDQAAHDYRLKTTSTLHLGASDNRDVGVGFSALVTGVGRNATAWLGVAAPPPEDGRPRQGQRTGPLARNRKS
jgi:hypothetical protein